MTADIGDNQFRIRDAGPPLLVLRERTQAILASNHDQGWARDTRKMEHGIRAVEKSLDLPVVLLGS